MTAERIALLMPRDDHHVVERSWGVRWSRSGIAFWRRCESVGPVPLPDGPTIVVRQGGRRGWVAAGVVALGSVGLTAAGVTAGPVLPRPERRALVSMEVPPAEPLAAKRAVTPHETRRPVALAAPARVGAAPETPPAPADVPPASVVEIGEEGPAETSFDRRTDALAAALSTGRLQSWTEPEGVRGFVVVGEAQAEADRTCREVSVLVKSGSGNDVERFRRCVGAPVAG